MGSDFWRRERQDHHQEIKKENWNQEDNRQENFGQEVVEEVERYEEEVGSEGQGEIFDAEEIDRQENHDREEIDSQKIDDGEEIDNRKEIRQEEDGRQENEEEVIVGWFLRPSFRALVNSNLGTCSAKVLVVGGGLKNPLRSRCGGFIKSHSSS